MNYRSQAWVSSGLGNRRAGGGNRRFEVLLEAPSSPKAEAWPSRAAAGAAVRARGHECVPAYRRYLRMGEPCVSVCMGEYACVRVNTCACRGACGTPKPASQGPCAPALQGERPCLCLGVSPEVKQVMR